MADASSATSYASSCSSAAVGGAAAQVAHRSRFPDDFPQLRDCQHAKVLAAAIKGAAGSLTSVDLRFNGFRLKLRAEGGVAVADAMKSCTQLTSLDLEGNNLGAEGGAAVADAMMSCTQLTSLNLKRNDLGAEGGAAVADAMMSCTQLTSLNLAGNKLGADCGAAVADAMKSCTQLTNLNLGSTVSSPK